MTVSLAQQITAVALAVLGKRDELARAEAKKGWPEADLDLKRLRIKELEAAEKTLRAIEPHQDEIRQLIMGAKNVAVYD